MKINFYLTVLEKIAKIVQFVGVFLYTGLLVLRGAGGC